MPLALSESSGNVFYGTEHHPHDSDGPWPLLAFLQHRDRSDIMTFQLYTIEADELAAESFNPTTQPCGYLSLDQEALTELAALLRSGATRLTRGRGAAQKMFRRIDNSELAGFKLHPEWFPDSTGQYYSQIYDPLEESRESFNRTILIFSAGKTRSRLYFKVAHFSRQALQNPSFDILDDSLPRINLDRDGMIELAYLLDGQLLNLV